ncbi:hypothetical protein GCM10009608_11960 [Pseudonocardia alaniniphila]
MMRSHPDHLVESFREAGYDRGGVLVTLSAPFGAEGADRVTSGVVPPMAASPLLAARWNKSGSVLDLCEKSGIAPPQAAPVTAVFSSLEGSGCCVRFVAEGTGVQAVGKIMIA